MQLTAISVPDARLRVVSKKRYTLTFTLYARIYDGFNVLIIERKIYYKQHYSLDELPESGITNKEEQINIVS